MPLLYSEIKPWGVYWLYSKRGPTDNRKIGSYQLLDGVITVPVIGDVARNIMPRGLMAESADGTFDVPCLLPGELGGWDLHVHAEPPATLPGAPLADTSHPSGLPFLPADDFDWPEELPDEYVQLFDLYTRSGRLRK